MVMKNCILFLVSLICLLPARAQNGNIAMAVAVPADSRIESNVRSILKNKLLRMVSAYGISGTEYGALAMIPEVDVVNQNVVSGGMRNITSVELSLTVKVENIITKTVFAAVEIPVRGDGYSEADAIRSAINKVNVSSAECKAFVETAKSKIYDYYSTNTETLITKANMLASRQLSDEALALLSTYPESLPGYAKISETMTDIFNKSLTRYCRQIMLSAQAAYSQRDYTKAAELAAMIDPESSCAQDAESMLLSIKDINEELYEEKVAMEKKMYDDMVEMGKAQIKSDERVQMAQINASRDIAKAYYQRQPNYIFL